MGVTHNLETGYDFTTEAGIITGRFDIVYTEALGTDTPAFDTNSIMVYKYEGNVAISSGSVDIKSVAVYDIHGRLLYSIDNVNAPETSITGLQVQEQMLIVNVTTIDGAKAGRKIIY